MKQMHEQRLKLVICMVRGCKIAKACRTAGPCQSFIAESAGSILNPATSLQRKLCNPLLAQIKNLEIHRELAAILMVQPHLLFQFLLIPELVVHVQRKQGPPRTGLFQGRQQCKRVTPTAEGHSNPCIGRNCMLYEK